jgi:hypothetical protein
MPMMKDVLNRILHKHDGETPLMSIQNSFSEENVPMMEEVLNRTLH